MDPRPTTTNDDAYPTEHEIDQALEEAGFDVEVPEADFWTDLEAKWAQTAYSIEDELDSEILDSWAFATSPEIV